MMKTIFDFNPTEIELKELFGFNTETDSMSYGFSIIPQPNSEYSTTTSTEEKILDIALLLELRGEQKVANEFWSKIPDVARQYRHGFDNQITFVN